MYRIDVKSPGKYYNVQIGSRYCFRKKTAKSLIDLFLKQDCHIEVEKLIRIHRDVFCWTWDEEDSVCNYYLEQEEF